MTQQYIPIYVREIEVTKYNHFISNMMKKYIMYIIGLGIKLIQTISKFSSEVIT